MSGDVLSGRLAAFAFAAFAFASAENTISLLEDLRQASTTSVGQL